MRVCNLKAKISSGNGYHNYTKTANWFREKYSLRIFSRAMQATVTFCRLFRPQQKTKITFYKSSKRKTQSRWLKINTESTSYSLMQVASPNNTLLMIIFQYSPKLKDLYSASLLIINSGSYCSRKHGQRLTNRTRQFLQAILMKF